ncbi:hypothetical protein JL722_4227 [Aureococcus anophagefferens]|nr:hypothetical protein JL722_4227 [Aureococcus anophagefferens]
MGLPRRGAAALACVLACAATSDTGPWWAYHELGEPVDVSRSLEAIRSVPIKRFEMTHDTVNGRVHYGVLAPDAEASLGPVYGETVTKEEAVPGAKGGLTRKVVDPGRALHARPRGAPGAERRRARGPGRGAPHLRVGRRDVRGPGLRRGGAPRRELVDGRRTETAAESRGGARARTLETKLRKIDAKTSRTRNVTRYDFATRNETSLQLDALAAATADFEHATAKATLQHNANATRATDAVLEDMRKATALKKLRDEFTVAEAREKLREATAVEVAREAERQAAEAERLNEDIALRMIRAQGAEMRRKLLEAITAVAGEVAKAADSLRLHPERLRRFVLGLVGVAGGYFATRESALLARRLLTQYLMRPALVRESSFSMSGVVVWTLGLVAKLFTTLLFLRRGPAHDDGAQVDVKTTKITDGIVLPDALGARLDQLAASVRGARKLRAPLRHLLLYGPPGTGKTMIARRLSQISGLDWAIMSGGDGLLLFVDEAEAALCDRGRPDLSEEAISALNAFLFHTSDPSYKFMLVLATNRPGDLDAAVLDRVDESVEIPLPGEAGRLALLRLYFAAAFAPPRLDTRLRRVVARGAVYATERESASGSLVLDGALWERTVRWKLEEVKPRSTLGKPAPKKRAANGNNGGAV